MKQNLTCKKWFPFASVVSVVIFWIGLAILFFVSSLLARVVAVAVGRDLFSYKECSDQKTYLAKVDQTAHITIEK